MNSMCIMPANMRVSGVRESGADTNSINIKSSGSKHRHSGNKTHRNGEPHKQMACSPGFRGIHGIHWWRREFLVTTMMTTFENKLTVY